MAEFSRRQLFKFRLGDLSREAGKSLAQDQRGPEESETHEPRFPRPPGALEDEDAFLETCERCHACSEACPHEAIKQFGPASGKLEGTPFIDPASAPCHWCVDMPCIGACPSGALHQKSGEAVAPIAKVTLDLTRCLNSEGILCDTCSYRCPGHVKAIRMVGRMPKLDSELCVGCGMCVYHCEAEVSAFELVVSEQARPM